MADLSDVFALAAESGYTDIVLWGLFVDHHWPLDIVSCCDADRRARIRLLVEEAHLLGLRLLCGLGLYSWGFDAVIDAHPHLSRDNRQVLCPSVEESHFWVERVLDFLMDGFGFDGLNMQSADKGRCTCEECRVLPTGEYHARLNHRAAQYVRARCPDAILVVDNWGCPISGPADLPALTTLSQEVSVIIDTDDSASRVGPGFRQTLAASLHCVLGTLAGRSVWPPQWWEPDRWFLPTTLINVSYLRALHADGGRGAEQFAVNLANPSDEITFRFMGALLRDPQADPDSLLQEVVTRVYTPKTAAAREKLTEIVRDAERAYFAHANRAFSDSGLFFVDAGFLPPDDRHPPTYLQDMTLEGRGAYAAEMIRLRTQFQTLHTDLGAGERADVTQRCFENVLTDIHQIETTL